MSVVSQIAPFGVRLPESLKQELKQVAVENSRSLNTEIVYRLQQSLKKEKQKAAKNSAGSET